MIKITLKAFFVAAQMCFDFSETVAGHSRGDKEEQGRSRQAEERSCDSIGRAAIHGRHDTGGGQKS